MKKILLSALLLSVGLGLWAQTNNNGVWYSLYDDAEHTMNTQGDYETEGVFAPTAGTLNVKWKYQWIDWFGVARKIDTEVLESSNGGSSTNKVGSLAENTDKNSNTTESFNVSRNINWIKFNRTGLPTHKVIVYHIDIPLAQHILLASGTYGATTDSHAFGTVQLLSASAPYKVNLRSFLSAGNITVSSSDPEIFHLNSATNEGNIVYSVGANACASANGNASAASSTQLGKIDNYAFDIYFTPKEARSYSATITISDGVSTAQVTVTGEGELIPTTVITPPTAPEMIAGQKLGEAELTGGEASVPGSFEWDKPTTVLTEGEHSYEVIFIPDESEIYMPATTQVTVDVKARKYEQNITWEDSIPQLYVGQTFALSAEASSGLPVTITSSDETIAYVDENFVLITLAAGDITLTAMQQGDSRYDAAESIVKTVSILTPPTTYSTYESVFCEGDSVEYRGVWYFADTQDTILLEEKNMLGGDSVILLTLTTNPVYLTEDNMTTRVGLSDTWQGIAVSELPVGDTTLIVHYASINGCDSAHVLHLTVEPMIITYGNDTVRLCSGERYVYEGKTYRRSMVDSVRVSERNQFGGDSIVELVVIVSPVMRLTASKTIEQGDEVMWQQYDLSEMPVGDTTLVASYTSVNGCDSVYTLNLTVIEKVNSAVGEISTGSRKTQKVFINGQLYIRKGETLYDLYGRKAE